MNITNHKVIRLLSKYLRPTIRCSNTLNLNIELSDVINLFTKKRSWKWSISEAKLIEQLTLFLKSNGYNKCKINLVQSDTCINNEYCTFYEVQIKGKIK